ncbi:MAG TPA: gas vesicle protein GvpG [Vicinamibacterales bacterium]|nr:gas vesicle protein GvpG [Vicinamibacterales bacterium]
MFILDSALVGGLQFVLDKLLAAAEAESQDDSALREQLLEAEMQLELGEISAARFAEIERDLLRRIRELRGTSKPLTLSSGQTVTGVEIETYDSER